MYIQLRNQNRWLRWNISMSRDTVIMFHTVFIHFVSRGFMYNRECLDNVSISANGWSSPQKFQVCDGIYCRVIAAAAKNFTDSIKTRVIDIKIVHMLGRREARQKTGAAHIAELRFVMYFPCSNIDSYMTRARESGSDFWRRKINETSKKNSYFCVFRRFRAFQARQRVKQNQKHFRWRLFFCGAFFFFAFEHMRQEMSLKACEVGNGEKRAHMNCCRQ